MDIDELRSYDKWIGKTAEEIITAVNKKDVGGWAKVFPDTLPLFAHQVRNFFNVEPKTLTRYPSDHADQFVAQIQEGFKKWGFVDTYSATVGLSGDVYKDEHNKTWYQMSPGGAIYHWGGPPTNKYIDGYYSQHVRGQDGIPIFKLISPDGTGGSLETIIRNDHKRSTIGTVNKPEFVGDLVDFVYRHRGSYNYSETVISGLPAHEKRDVAPHKKYPDYYINISDPFSALSRRRFPAHKPDGKLIGYEKGMEPYEGIDTTRPDPPRPSHDSFATQMSPPHYPLNDKRSVDVVKNLEYLFRSWKAPRGLLARIETRRPNDEAVKYFHTPTIIAPHTAKRLLQILRDRP